jgi:glycine dehydrogenase subunit 2
VKKTLEPYLPIPRIRKSGKTYSLEFDRKESIGRIRAFYGNFGMLVRAYTYIREMGPEGLKRATELAVLNANYMSKRLEPHYHTLHKGNKARQSIK